MSEDCWLENAIICHPPNNKIEKEETVDWCRPNILSRIKELRPEKIILLGGTAIHSVIGSLWREDTGAVVRWAGYQIPDQKYNCWICPTYHPSYVVRDNPIAEILFEDHIKKAIRIKPGRPWKEKPNFRKDVEPILSPTEAAKRLKRLLQTPGTFAFDYETNCLKPDGQQARIVCCSVCKDGKETISFPMHGAVAGLLRDFLSCKEYKKVGTNIKFEDRWSWKKLGVRVQGWRWDTMLAAHTLENASKTKKVTSLKFQAFAYFGQGPYDWRVSPYLEAYGGNGLNRIQEIDPEELLIYCGIDSLLEYKLATLQIRKMGYRL